MSVLEKVQLLCKNQGVSISKLESHLNFSRGSIYKWNKSSPTSDKLKKVADYFDVSIDWLLGRSEEKRNIIKKDNKNQMIDEFLDQLVEEGIIDNPNNIDNSTAEMILNAVKAQVALKIKRKEGKNK